MRRILLAAVLSAMSISMPAMAVTYAIDDGTAERTVGIDGGEDQIWFNTFPVQPGGELITSVSAAFGRPGLSAFPLDDLGISVLVYEDPDGGSPVNATLLSSAEGLVAGAHQNVLTQYDVPPVVVHGTLLVGVLFSNVTGGNLPIAALDTTTPTFAGRSWAGFTGNGLNPANLASIPAGQLKPIEDFALAGNFLVRANGAPAPEPAGLSFIAGAMLLVGRGRRAI